MAAKELAERSSDGIFVRLYWDDEKPAGSDLLVVYEDTRWDVHYTLYPSRDEVLEAYYHPNAYAAKSRYDGSELRATG